MTPPFAIVIAAVVLGTAARGHADDAVDADRESEEDSAPPAWTPTTMVAVGAQAGLEDPPGAVVVLDVGVGHRVGSAIWQLRGVRSIFAGRMGGGSVSESARLWEVRAGPSFLRCAPRRCAGVATELGLQRLTRREYGAEGGPVEDETQRDLVGVFDVRLRILAVARPLTLEANVGLRLKAQIHRSGEMVHRGGERFGGGFLLGLAAGTVF